MPELASQNQAREAAPGFAAPLLVTGATGYVGGRLAPLLLSRGRPVRCLVRNPDRLQGRSWTPQAEVIAGDVLCPESLVPALAGIHTAYYFVRVAGGGTDRWEANLQGARHFARAARAAGLKNIIYLADLAEVRAAEARSVERPLLVGDILRESGVPVTEFRAAGIIGSGSMVFELVHSLVQERFPVPCPRLFHNSLRPVALEAVLDYLTVPLGMPGPLAAVVEVGGPETLTFAQMLLRCAQAGGRKRTLVPVPGGGHCLASWWAHLLTPVPGALAGRFFRGLASGLCPESRSADGLFAHVPQHDYAAALQRALAEQTAGRVETSWRDALGEAPELNQAALAHGKAGRLACQCRQLARATPEAVHRAGVGLGGTRGWLYWHWAWQLRGACDRVLGGVGLQRGRRAPDELRAGDALDFWRVESLVQGRSLRLRAEMQVPGLAWLEFETLPQTDGNSELVQTAVFDPAGWVGRLYWWALYPVHRLIFRGLVRQLARQAEVTRCPQPAPGPADARP